MRSEIFQNYSTATVGELGRALRERRIGAVELFEEAVREIELRDVSINAIVVRDFDRAREAAKAADLGLARGDTRPLLGIPMTVKEAFAVAGLATTWGLEKYRGLKAETDAVAVERLKTAGAVIIGKSNIAPDLRDWQSANLIYGRTSNPHDLSLTSGGSSGGAAAALAAGMVPLELGSDIAGSIRVPAAFCGVFGHKPSYELVPQRGHAPGGFPRAPAIFNVVGPMARSAEDLEMALDVLSGPDEFSANAPPVTLRPARHDRLSDFRILCLDSHPATPVDDGIRAALIQLAGELRRLGARVEQRWPATIDLMASFRSYIPLLLAAQTREAYGCQKIGAPEVLSRSPLISGWMAWMLSRRCGRHRWHYSLNGTSCWPRVLELPHSLTLRKWISAVGCSPLTIWRLRTAAKSDGQALPRWRIFLLRRSQSA